MVEDYAEQGAENALPMITIAGEHKKKGAHNERLTVRKRGTRSS
jgi:hypothetical protein